KIDTRHRMAPLELLVDDVAVPQLALLGRLGVDDDLIAVPGFDGGDEFLAVLEFALFDFTCAAFALGVVLVAGAEVGAGPFAGLHRQQVDAFVAGGEYVLPFAAGHVDRLKIVRHVQAFIEHLRHPAIFGRVLGYAIRRHPQRRSVHPIVLGARPSAHQRYRNQYLLAIAVDARETSEIDTPCGTDRIDRLRLI